LFRNGVKYAGEIHFVYTNPKTNKTAVLGIFMESNRTENSSIEEWKRYFTVTVNLDQINNSTVLNLNLASLMGDNLNDFWRYDGSLTTPPCTEGIIWTIFKTPIVFNENELESFRKNLFSEDYRGPQPLHDRIVYRNFLNKTLSSISDYNYCSKDLDSNLSNRLFDQNYYFFINISRIFILFIFYCKNII